MSTPHPVLFVKSLREQRLRSAVQRAAQAVRDQEARLEKAAHLCTQLTTRHALLVQHRTAFAGGAGDLLACDAAAVATAAWGRKATDTLQLRHAELQQARALHLQALQRWQAAQQGLRLATERLQRQKRHRGALCAAALEEDVAETHGVARLPAAAGGHSLEGPP